MSFAAFPVLRALPATEDAARARLLQNGKGAMVALGLPVEGGAPHAPAALGIDAVTTSATRSRKRWFTVPQLLGGLPEWDAMLDRAGRPVLVVTDFGGAINSLEVLAVSGRTSLPPFAPSDDLRDPRFVRGSSGVPALTALVNERDVILFVPGSGGGYRRSMLARADASGAAIDNALLLDTGAGPVLLTRRPETGRQRGRFPGVLQAQPLTRDHRPAGPAFAVFGAQRIFDFDADVTPNGFAAVAITDEGFALARADSGRPVHVESYPRTSLAGPVSMLARPTSLQLAFMAPDGGVLLGFVRY